MIDFSEYEVLVDYPATSGGKMINSATFFTPAEFKGFQTHLMYESLYDGKMPTFVAEFNFSECDSAKTNDRIHKRLRALLGNQVLWHGVSTSQYVASKDDPDDKDREDTQFLIAYKDGFMVHTEFSISDYSNTKVAIFSTDQKQYEDAIKILRVIGRNLPTLKKDRTNNFYMVTHNGRTLDLAEFKINRKKFPTFDIDGSYNDDFKEVASRIEDFINNEEETGIVLLHGCPGSGKTTFIRYLLSKTSSKRIIYLPPDLATELSSPSFFNFIRQYDNSVLLIEDAENILRSREGGGNQSIANLLNMSDGIMGDALKIQIICTFNAPFSDIDEALKRPGRLITSYHFDKLSAAKTKAMVKRLYGDEVEPENYSMTLAEIYTMGKDKLVREGKKKTRMGFV